MLQRNHISILLVFSLTFFAHLGCLPSNGEIPNPFKKEVTAEQTDVVERFVLAISQGDFIAAQSMFDPSLRTKWSAKDLETMWMSLVAENGAFVAVTEYRGHISDFSHLEVFPEFSKFAPRKPAEFFVFLHFGNEPYAESIVLELSDDAQIVFMIAGDEEHSPV